MNRKFTEPKLLIASNNAGKVKEIAALLAPFGVEVVSAASFNLTEPEEDGDSFLANAAIKARYYSKATGLPALADDSGLCVTALNDAPGIYSARWAGEKKDFTLAMQRIEDAIKEKDSDDFSAYFICALCLYWPDGEEIAVEGRIDGQLSFPPRGDKGFGYDPIFIPQGYQETFGEMQGELKQKLSHRSNAFNKLIGKCFDDAAT